MSRVKSAPPLQSDGWKPPRKWVVTRRRGFEVSHVTHRSYDAAKADALDALDGGWEEAWISEKE